eukprot:CAMPEP_0119560280 /NCGR_PEP_ID=MMETSP1352-20130426/14482_1 /TAXON_ID=265584 /ORGANISM="Stauroneis constricta, Strain CCMP1120" /LENGTH=128 /DNA_ID=CAMNT_0007608229 /DNA_START=22 /DNA_END=409 /DNA_ORIENTATION=+
MQIFIKTLTGRKQAFNFEPDNQVLAVKQALQEKEGIQVDQIRLIHSGKQLADDKTLESYNIAAGATIHMVLQLEADRVFEFLVDHRFGLMISAVTMMATGVKFRAMNLTIGIMISDRGATFQQRCYIS